MKKLGQKFLSRSISPILFLILLEIIIFATNYIQGTYLIGWDTIMPEFNLPLNFQRGLTSVWQEYRGLGTLDGLSHAANLLHTFYIWTLSLFLPQSLLRYTFIHLMHLMGGIGMYFLLKNILTSVLLNNSEASKNVSLKSFDSLPPKADRQDDKTNTSTLMLTALFGAVFYMLNLGIIQMFYAPLEVFAVHFAALPIICYQLLETFQQTNRKNLFLLFLFSLLFSPQGFVPTVFIVFSLLIGSLMLFDLMHTKNLKKTFIIGLIIFLANAFWMLPYLYSAIHTPSTIQSTKINQIASEEIFYRNKAHGDLPNVFSLRGFMLSTAEFDVTARRDIYFMQRWLGHSDTVLYKIIYFVIFTMMIGGVWLAVKKRMLLPFLLPFGIGLLFLANNTPGLEQFNTWFRAVFPILGEAFRFPFTKFITLFAFCYSIFFSLCLLSILTKWRDYLRQIVIILSLFLLYISYPAFQGYFTAPYLRLKLPDAYPAFVKHMQRKAPQARVATLPAHTFWNWQFRSWPAHQSSGDSEQTAGGGYRGSGFLWYGIPQPLMERAFDPWSLANEQYYSEIAAAYNGNDQEQFNHVLNKYAITYILLDETILNNLAQQPINYDSLKSFLDTNNALIKDAEFGELTLYRIKDPQTLFSVISSATALPTVNDPFVGRTIGIESTMVPATVPYFTDTQPVIMPLFPSLSTEKLQEDLTFEVTKKPHSFVLARNTDVQLKGTTATLTVPSLFTNEFLVPIEVETVSEGLLVTPLYPEIRINDQSLPLRGEPLLITPQRVRQPTSLQFMDTKHTIPFQNGKARSYLLNPYSNTLKLVNGTAEEVIVIDTQRFSKDPLRIPLSETHVNSIEVEIPTFSSPFYYADLISRNIYDITEIDRNLPSVTGKRAVSATTDAAGVHLTARNTGQHLSFYLNNLYHQGSYLLHVTSDHTDGLPVNFYIDNTYHKRAELETVLSVNKKDNFILIPPTEKFYQGYGFHFTVKSIGNEKAAATLQNTGVYPFPHDTIAHLLITTDAYTDQPPLSPPSPVRYISNSLSSYTVAPVKSDMLLTFTQAYDSGWKAYAANSKWPIANGIFPFIFGKEIKDHVKVNNWANGWVMTKDQKPKTDSQIIILYLPQYLQYLGQFLTLSAFIWLVTATLLKRRA